MSLLNPDANEIGRYEETTSLNTTFSSLLNLALASVSAAFTKYVRTRTIRSRTTGTIASSSGFTALPLATAVIGSDFTHSAGVLTCVNAGTYRVRLSASIAANATGNRGARLLGSGSLGSRATIIASLGAAFDQTVEVEWVVTLAANDTITAQVFQNSGSALTVLGHILLERVV